MTDIPYNKILLIDDDENALIPYVLPATNADLGVVKPDNTSITIDSNGVISVPIATYDNSGIVKQDNNSIINTNGILKVSTTWLIPYIIENAMDLITQNVPTATVCFIARSGLSGNNLNRNWLICDGSAISRTAYPALFAQIETYYGSGDGSTTFNIPNLIDKYVYGTTHKGQTASPKTENTTTENTLHNHTYNEGVHQQFLTGGNNQLHTHKYTKGVAGAGLLPIIKYTWSGHA